MADGVRVTLNRAGVRRLLTSAQVAAALGQVADRIADRVRSAGIRVEHEPGDIPLPVDVHVHTDGGRARALVVLAHPAGAAVEAKHRLLLRSIDASA